MKTFLRGCALTIATTIAASVTVSVVRADGHGQATAIVDASVSADQSMLLVRGTGFGSAPAVYLDGMLLGGIAVNASGTQVTAIMPALQPGSYLLMVQRNRMRRDDDDDGARVASFVLAVGAVGPNGEKGDKGDKGDQGDKGDKGDQGIQGVKGDQGLQGIQGVKGDKGDQGIQGIQGIPGVPGAPGQPGAKGDKGDPGAPGAGLTFALDGDTFLPEVGGGGGSPFSFRACPSGQLAVGVIVRAGNDMDAFGLSCAPEMPAAAPCSRSVARPASRSWVSSGRSPVRSTHSRRTARASAAAACSIHQPAARSAAARTSTSPARLEKP